jgi:hypothetical protein
MMEEIASPTHAVCMTPRNPNSFPGRFKYE